MSSFRNTSYFDEIFNEIEINQQKKKQGYVNSIFWEMPRLTNVLNFPGFVPGKYYCVTANSHIGKTIFSKFLVLYSSYMRRIEYNGNFEWEVLWLALEEGEIDFWQSLIAFCVYLEHGNKYLLTPEIITGKVKRDLSTEELDVVKKARYHPFFIECTKRVSVVDNIFNPTGIKYQVDKFLQRKELATWEERVDMKGITNYKMKDNHFAFVVTDNTNLLQEEKNHNTGAVMNKAATMEFYSSTYCLGVFCKRYGAIVIDIQQQSAESEAKLYTNRGEVIESKLEPTLADLGDSKKTARNMDVVLGLFNPIRHEINKVGGFNIDIPILNGGNKFRRLIFLKDRLGGLSGNKLNLYCEGYVPFFKEMYPSSTYKENPELINKILKNE